MIRRGFLPAVAAIYFFAAAAYAHNPDTSYARFTVSGNALETKFTFDVFTLLRIVPGLDANGDRQISKQELLAQTPRVFDFLRKHVVLEINTHDADFGEAQPVAWPTDIGDTITEKDWHSGAALLHFVFRQPPGERLEQFRVEFNVFTQLGERHTVLGAIRQGDHELEIVFTRDEPDYLYDAAYDSAAAKPVDAKSGSSQSGGLAHQLAKFFRLGVEHIFLGYDHILFLLALIVVSRLGELVKIVTSFTVAHTITLILAALQIVRIPSRLVESAIALTIIYVALENFWIKNASHRWMLTFFFGLVHGFGFANALRDSGMPTSGLVPCLLCFNVGVEVGQLAIVCVLFPFALMISRWQYGVRAQMGLSGAICLFGLGWFVERAFGIQFMPI